MGCQKSHVLFKVLYVALILIILRLEHSVPFRITIRISTRATAPVIVTSWISFGRFRPLQVTSPSSRNWQSQVVVSNAPLTARHSRENHLPLATLLRAVLQMIPKQLRPDLAHVVIQMPTSHPRMNLGEYPATRQKDHYPTN